MSLNGALQVGRSAITAAQTAIQVAGNNMANAATDGYHRRSVHFTSARDEMVSRNAFVGTGVTVLAIRREFDSALQSRFRDSTANEFASFIDKQTLAQIESLQNELTDNDISSAVTAFFSAFSELANNPDDQAVRAVVIEEGRSLSNRIANLRSDYSATLAQLDRQLSSSVSRAHEILGQIAEINIRITGVEQGIADANGLRDARDQMIDELSQFMEVTTIEQENGVVDVFVDSIPVVLAATNRGIELRTETVSGALVQSIRVADDGTTLSVDSGRIGGLLRQRSDTVQPVIDTLNTFASEIIFQVNRVHSQGQGLSGFQNVTGTYGVNDLTANLNSATAGLKYKADNGSFFIHVTHSTTGARTTHEVTVDGNADSMNDLINEINVVVNVPNVTASVGLNSTLDLAADAGFEISFSDDTSGALAALGINTFFTGSVASDMAVNTRITADSGLLAAGAGHIAGSNDTAVALANLPDTPVTSLNNKSLREFWVEGINTVAVAASAANDSAESTTLVRESLHAQIQSVSGVSIDEESINLLTFQRQFQAAARFISVIDEAIQTLLNLIR